MLLACERSAGLRGFPFLLCSEMPGKHVGTDLPGIIVRGGQTLPRDGLTQVLPMIVNPYRLVISGPRWRSHNQEGQWFAARVAELEVRAGWNG